MRKHGVTSPLFFTKPDSKRCVSGNRLGEIEHLHTHDGTPQWWLTSHLLQPILSPRRILLESGDSLIFPGFSMNLENL